MKVQVKVYQHLFPFSDISTADSKNLDYSSVLSTFVCSNWSLQSKEDSIPHNLHFAL